VSKRTVLVVDDSPVSRAILRQCLPRDGELEVLEANGGHAALALHAERSPDITFLDLTMGDISGVECLREIKARCASAVVVVVTADVQARTREQVLALGALEVIGKPPTKQKIAAALARAAALAETSHVG
jgi:two-component system chemotaxis response regulator CheY